MIMIKKIGKTRGEKFEKQISESLHKCYGHVEYVACERMKM